MVRRSRRGRHARFIAFVSAVAVLASGCFFELASEHERRSPETRPWFCNAVGDGTPLSGHGNGNHVHPAYAGAVKGPLSWDDCKALGRQLDTALGAVRQWPTKGRAEAGGWMQIAQYIPGLGTHHSRGLNGITNTTPFDPASPQFLIYGGRTADAPLVGLAYSYVAPSPDVPPEGFAGGNDWYHLHRKVCMSGATILAGAEEISDATCASLGGAQLGLGNLFLLHLWVVFGREYRPDLFISGHPCLLTDGPAPPGDPCWDIAFRDPALGPPPTSTTTPAHDHGR